MRSRLTDYYYYHHQRLCKAQVQFIGRNHKISQTPIRHFYDFLHIQYDYDLPGCHGLTIIAVNPQAKRKCHAVSMSFSYILKRRKIEKLLQKLKF
jgi:hypothetical protein